MCDATAGLIEAWFSPGATLGALGGGGAGYGDFDVNSTYTATIVDCASAPGLL